jgi:dTDP-4-amino-4,6-dideoxygalactose transaminase
MEFIDLKAQQARIKDEIDSGIAAVLSHGRYIMGPEVKSFEAALKEFGQTEFAIGCANGTDALILPLMAWEVGPGDAVFCPSFTYCATAEAVAVRGATPVFIDIDRDTYNICVNSLRRAITDVITSGKLRARAIIAVDLFGQSADYPAIKAIADEFSLKIIADSAQGFGTTLDSKHPAHWADIATTSFFPAKPLGCYGDGGAILTNDAALAQIIDSAHIHGKGTDKYDNVRLGMNSRLDTLQAAILLPKLAIFADEIEKRNNVAARYIEGLSGHVLRTPSVLKGVISTWAQFTIEVKDPLDFADKLKAEGIPTARYYPRPIHQQTAYSHYPSAGNGLPNTEDCIDKIISLPMHPYLSEDDQDRIIEITKVLS